MTDPILTAYLLSHFSKEVSKELCDYARDEIFIDSRYIFTSRINKRQYGYCTHCHKEFPTQGTKDFPIGNGLKHNEKAQCPKCHSECTVKASGYGRGKMVDQAYFVYYEKSIINPKVIVARGLYAIRDYRKSYKKVETLFETKTWYVFDTENGSAMIKETYGWFHGPRMEKCKSVHCYFSHYEYSSFGYPRANMRLGYSRKSIEEAVKGTPFSWSGWETYNYQDMVKFFDLYSKYPCVEYLTKLGFRNLVQDKLIGKQTYNAINWRGKNLFKVLKLTKQELNEIKSKKIHVSLLFLKIFQMARKNSWNLTLEEIENVESLYGYELDTLQLMSEYGPIKTIVNYLKKQHESLSTWRDYINDCKKLGMDLTKESIVYPKNLYAAHQKIIKLIKYEKNKVFDKKIENRLKFLNKYLFEYNGLIIRPAKNSKELIDEGSKLNHCVGGYVERYADGQTNILFIRKKDKPNEPYYTAEITNNRIIQVRCKDNFSPIKDSYKYRHDEVVEKFIEEFKKSKLTKKKNKTKIPA